MDEQQNAEGPEAESPAPGQGAAEGQDQAGPAGEATGPGKTESEARGQAAERGPGAPPTGTGAGTEPPPLPPELQSANATKDERTWAMLCHLAALGLFIFPAFGNILGPLIFWLVKREESKFIDFHGRQALWFQIWVSILLVPVLLVALLLAVVLVCLGAPVMFLAGAAGVGAVVYSVVGAIQVSGGKDFEYYWVGPWVRRSMM